MEKDVALKTSPSALNKLNRQDADTKAFPLPKPSKQFDECGSSSTTICQNEGGNQEIEAQTKRDTRSDMSVEHPKLVLKLVRHGETEENRKKIIQGQLDFPLNALGHRQAELVAKALRSVPFKRALSSDLARATQVWIKFIRIHIFG
jgi:hypothetical protein